MAQKNKPSFIMPRKQELHVSFPRIMSEVRQCEDERMMNSSHDYDTLFLPHWMHKQFIENGAAPDQAFWNQSIRRDSRNNMKRKTSSSMKPHLLLLQSSSEASQEDQTAKEPHDPLMGFHNKYFPSTSFLNWSKLHSKAAQMHAKTRELVPYQQATVDLAQAIGMMQNITVHDFETIWQPVKFSSRISIAKHMSNVEDRRLEPTELLMIAVRNFWFDNLELKIGNEFMHVDRYLFCHYMKAFHDHSNCFLELPSHKVSLNLMVRLYNWIIKDHNELALGSNFLLMYMMAKFLDVRYLLEQYWYAFSIPGNKGIWEAEAFHAYLPSRQLQCGDLMSIFLARIRKCFLPLVSSFEFLNLSANEVIYLLKMDMICVNSEDEMFFAAIRWLEHDWQNREQYLVHVMATLRFRMLSPWLQRSIAYQPENEQIRKVGSNNIVKAMLWQACLFGEAACAYKENPDCHDNVIVGKYSQIKDVERFWAYCQGVPHHHDIRCPRFRQLTYGTFKLFLNRLQSDAHSYMDELKIVPYKHWNTYNCCNDFKSFGNGKIQARFVCSPVYKF
ncbi:uncharacterized protein [Drosophila virilis]|uniref:uncharacterized protein isoform X1 n=1 Tax=Drosophila virilis TaxID=7244 RepID=UPI001396530D|nr:uncharacterized protein LOC6627968 isoform X1 [Drosophila virilis]